jgi:hypothetical protein
MTESKHVALCTCLKPSHIALEEHAEPFLEHRRSETERDRVFTQHTPMRRCEHSTALRALPLVSPCLSRQAGLHDFRKPVQGLAHALDQFFNRRFLFDDLFHHRVTGQRSASAQPLYPSETTCSQCAARRETHTADNTRNDEQAHNYQEEQCIHRAVSFLSRVGCRCLMRSAVNSRLTPTPCLPAQGMC